MPIAMYYMTGCIVALFLAMVCPWWWISLILIWVALSLGLVAIAYIKNNGMIFHKRSDGRIPWPVRVLFWPFMLGVYLYNRLIRTRSSSPTLQEIEPGLYVAARLTPIDMAALREANIGAVLDVTAEFESLNWSAMDEGIKYLNVPVLDHAYPDFASLLQAIRWIDSQRRQQRRVVVHCALGRGRSVMVMAAYLLARTPGSSLDDIINHIQSVRRYARLNRNQRHALEAAANQKEFGLSKPSAWLIANPVSGGGKWPQYRGEILATLAPHFVLTVRETTETLSATELAKEALNANPEIIIAGGGDGTVNEVAAVLVGNQVRFGILPLGTANALCHALWGIRAKLTPVSLACDAIVRGEAHHVDVATCNDRIALLIVAVGFEQQMIEFANRDAKNEQGQVAYLKGFVNAVTQGTPLTLTVRFDDEDEQVLETSSMVIANAAPFSTVLAQGSGAPDINDGKLDVTWIPTSDNLSTHVLSITELVLAGLTSEKLGGLTQHRQVTSLTIHHPEGLNYVIDGELFQDDVLQIAVRPDALQILSPKPEPGDELHL